MIRRSSSIVVLSLVVAVAGLVGYTAWAGPLDPPAGPVAPTYKTLTEVEPRIAINATNTLGDADSLFKITLPGSYYLTSNITGVVGKHGIEIAVSGVTLDLNGFDLVGVPAMGAFDGVTVTVGNLTNIAVVNGSVRNWGDEGVDLATFGVNNCRVEGVLASGNAGNGISTGSNCTITNCSATANTGNGINATAGSTAANCSAKGNVGAGINTGQGVTVTNCTVTTNTGNGIRSQNVCTITNCTVDNNHADGIVAGISCTVAYCSVESTVGTGISTSLGCTVTNCSAFSSTSSGISTSNGCTVAGCTVQRNTLDGIVCTTACVIRGNTCMDNGFNGDGAGIHATGVDNRIEGNTCTLADRGIDVDTARNLIIKNACSGNAIDWTIAANNVFGPIVDRRTPASAAVSGFTAASTLGSTDPNANFSY